MIFSHLTVPLSLTIGAAISLTGDNTAVDAAHIFRPKTKLDTRNGKVVASILNKNGLLKANTSNGNRNIVRKDNNRKLGEKSKNAKHADERKLGKSSKSSKTSKTPKSSKSAKSSKGSSSSSEEEEAIKRFDDEAKIILGDDETPEVAGVIPPPKPPLDNDEPEKVPVLPVDIIKENDALEEDAVGGGDALEEDSNQSPNAEYFYQDYVPEPEGEDEEIPAAPVGDVEGKAGDGKADLGGNEDGEAPPPLPETWYEDYIPDPEEVGGEPEDTPDDKAFDETPRVDVDPISVTSHPTLTPTTASPTLKPTNRPVVPPPKPTNAPVIPPPTTSPTKEVTVPEKACFEDNGVNVCLTYNFDFSCDMAVNGVSCNCCSFDPEMKYITTFDCTNIGAEWGAMGTCQMGALVGEANKELTTKEEDESPGQLDLRSPGQPPSDGVEEDGVVALSVNLDAMSFEPTQRRRRTLAVRRKVKTKRRRESGPEREEV